MPSFQEKSPLPGASGFEPGGPSRCPECGLPYGGARFGWGGGKPGAHAERCPACGQVHDEFPGGTVILRGPVFGRRRKEVLEWVAAVETRIDRDHPGKLIESIEPREAEVLVRTSDARVARRIGDALCKAFGGALEYRYPHPPTVLNVEWTL